VKVSIKQIGQITGFSPATVSNALNHKKGVNSETSEKILKAAKEMGYQTEKAITKIKFVTYRKNGLIIDDSLIFPAMIEGVERQAKELGYETIFSHLNYSDETFKARLTEVLEDVNSLVILLGTEMLEEDYVPFKEFEGRIVLLDGWCEEGSFDSVLINNTDAACKAVRYLVEKGHKEIGYLRGDYRINAFRYREHGYHRILREQDLDVLPEYAVTIGTQIETAYEDMKKHLNGTPKLPTAFFADNDVIALGALRALQEKGIRIPDQISIVGFDDVKFGSISMPGLTTIHVYKQEMGEIAVRRVLDPIHYKNGDVRTKIQVCTQFVERGSVRDIKQKERRK